MKKKYLPVPILVNADMEVIDGQHRLEAAKRLLLDVYYIIDDETDIETVQQLNSHSKNWTIDDYMRCYSELKKQEYVNFLDMIREYDFSVSVGLAVCGFVRRNNIYGMIRNGTFKIPNVNNAYDTANKIKRIRPYYKGYKRRSFVNALCSCLKKKGFDFEDFIQKLSYQSSKLVDCATESQYIEVIEEIYNYKRSDKVNLRIS